jgi:hypothetical protein
MKLDFFIAGLIFATILGTGTSVADENAELAKKLSNPIANLISVPFQTNYDEGYGTKDGYKIFTNVQPVVPINLSEDWNLISRTIIPIIWKQHNIAGASGKQSGLGDTAESLWLSPVKPMPMGGLGNFVWGLGPIAVFPTGNGSPLRGSGKLSLGVTPLGLFIKGGLVYGALANHVWSVAGKDSRADISSTFIQPFIAYTTEDAVTFSINSESTYNWKTENWSIPINLQLSKLTSIGGQKVSFQIGARYWVESPKGGPDGLGARFTTTFLFPK